MSIGDEINRISGNVGASLDALTAKGVNVPEGANSNDLATLIAAVPTGGGGVQSDWNVNDESDPAYIKNRPFYRIATESVLVDVVTDFVDIGGPGLSLDACFEETIVEGCNYTVVFDGIEYQRTALAFEGVPYVGNAGIMGLDDTGEPFFLFSPYGPDGGTETYSSSAGEHSIKVTGTHEEIKKLDADLIESVVWPGDGADSVVLNSRTNKALGMLSTASGDGSWAYGFASHAEGVSEAHGTASHAEGASEAHGFYSHSEGLACKAGGQRAHAEGWGTIATSDNQHTHGRWNVEDAAGTYAHIVGNGTGSTKRSNAHTLDWDGNAWYAGTVEGTAVILKSPNGTRYKVTVSDSGALSAAKL